MFEVVFYEKADGKSDLWDFLETLRNDANSIKDARIQYKQLIYYIELLKIMEQVCRLH